MGVLAIRGWHKPQVQLCAIYALVSIAIGMGFLGGAGVDWNVLFDADMALALSAALVLDGLRGRWRAILAAAYVAPFCYYALTTASWRQADFWLHPLREQAATARQDIALIASRPGPALCQMLSFCYWAGKSPAVDVFNVGQQIDTGVRSDAELVGSSIRMIRRP